MKRSISTSICVLLLYLGSMAQGFTLLDENGNNVTNDTIHITMLHEDYQTDVHIHVVNEYASTKSVLARKRVIQDIGDTFHTFCWAGTCYDSVILISPNSQLMNPGDTITEFVAEFRPYDNSGKVIIDYTFYVYHSSDSSRVVIVYQVGSSGISDVVISGSQISDAFPNPANRNFSVTYSLLPDENASLSVFNILGAKVKEIPIVGSKGTITVQVGDLEEGLYFYSFKTKEKTIKTERLFIVR